VRIEAIVIKKSDQGEHGETVQLYTATAGKVMAVAKGLKRKTSKQAAHLEPFNLIDCRLIAGQGLPIIASAHSRASFPDIKASLPKLALGFYLLELMDQLIYENEADSTLWQWLKTKLENLEQLDGAELDHTISKKYLLAIRAELMDILGYKSLSSGVAPAVEYLMQNLVNRPALALQFSSDLFRDLAVNEVK